MMILLLFALILTGLTVIIHGAGTLFVLSHIVQLPPEKRARPFIQALHVIRTIAALLIVHLVEAAVWAAFFVLADALPDLETALYYSMTSYTTVGYGDVLLPATWRLLGPIEAAVGILMFGWSTAIIVAAINRIYGERIRSLVRTGDQPPEA
jgi:voltage-gated potassium channel